MDADIVAAWHARNVDWPYTELAWGNDETTGEPEYIVWRYRSVLTLIRDLTRNAFGAPLSGLYVIGGEGQVVPSAHTAVRTSNGKADWFRTTMTWAREPTRAVPCWGLYLPDKQRDRATCEAYVDELVKIAARSNGGRNAGRRAWKNPARR